MAAGVVSLTDAASSAVICFVCILVLVSTATGRSWPRCLVWTSVLVKRTSLSNTQHQSSPEKAPHQVEDANHGHLGLTGTITPTVGRNLNMSFVFV